MERMMKTISVSGLAVAIIVLISGCVARPHYPQPTVFSNGVTYKPTWDGYGSCKPYNDRPNAECSVEENGPVVKYLEPDIKTTMESFINNSSNITELCDRVNRLKLFPDYNSPNSCENHVLKQLYLNVETYTYSYAKDYEKAYQIGLIDKKTWLIYNGRALEAYQSGLIDKDTARSKMLARGQIVEAYEAKLIDKDTADLYLKQHQIRNTTIAAQQQQAIAKKQAEAAEDQAAAARRASSPDLLQQQLQNITNYNQMNQMINQQNTNNNMRKYY